MNYLYFIGWDTSKEKLNYHIRNDSGDAVQEGEVNNKVDSILSFFQQLFEQLSVPSEQVLNCVENTGIYSNFILSASASMEIPVWLEDPYQLNRSAGRRKDKTDKLDARSISDYAFTHQRKTKLWTIQKASVHKIRFWNRQLQTLVKNNQRTKTLFKEMKAFAVDDLDSAACQIIEQNIEQTEKSIQALSKRIEQIIAEDTRAKRVYDIARSVPGLGPKNTLAILSETGMFVKVPNARACASYAGVSPHQHESGSSVKRKKRVSKAANKKLKTAFSQAAFSMIRHPSVFKELYDRLIAKGREHLQALNAVRNKIIRILYACLEKDVTYDKKYHINLHVT